MNLGEPKFTVVVPLIPQHDFEIRRILKLLANEQNLIKQVIICRSETKDSGRAARKKYKKYAESVGFLKEISVDCVKSVARDGTNRNRGWLSADTEFVAFLDADDLYSKDRLSVILESFRNYKADAIVHNYNSTGGVSSDFEFLTANKSNSSKVVLGKKFDANDYLADINGNELKVHFAHITVRNEIKDKLMFTDRFPGADWEFATSLVELGYEMRYIDAELSAWNRKRSSRYLIRIYKMRLFAKLKNLMKIKSH
jgi:glycosyltransferase involved in cell wall biosynthesis